MRCAIAGTTWLASAKRSAAKLLLCSLRRRSRCGSAAAQCGKALPYRAAALQSSCLRLRLSQNSFVAKSVPPAVTGGFFARKPQSKTTQGIVKHVALDSSFPLTPFPRFHLAPLAPQASEVRRQSHSRFQNAFCIYFFRPQATFTSHSCINSARQVNFFAQSPHMVH